jgi:hypothetical protein
VLFNTTPPLDWQRQRRHNKHACCLHNSLGGGLAGGGWLAGGGRVSAKQHAAACPLRLLCCCLAPAQNRLKENGEQKAAHSCPPLLPHWCHLPSRTVASSAERTKKPAASLLLLPLSSCFAPSCSLNPSRGWPSRRRAPGRRRAAGRPLSAPPLPACTAQRRLHCYAAC